MTTWTEKTQQAETWTDSSQQAETWTVVSQQTEDWTPLITIRGFDPSGFSNTPDFDTGSGSGIWARKTEQAETWT